MCGIAGFIDPKITKDSAENLIGKMLRCIVHRGPDHTAHYIDMPVVLGHNRLSILDLSSEADQPMHYMDLVMIFNGEIYNFIEIRDRLSTIGYKFKTTGDSEVILAAYKEWGEDCVKEFMGMWAFAIWDKSKRKLFCSRDRFGIKPFYYISNSGRIYFGSEIKTLKFSPLYTNQLNLNQVSRGLQLGWTSYEDETYFQLIKSIPAAHNLVWENEEIRINKYWDINFDHIEKGSFNERKEVFKEKFFNSINLHLRSDVEVGGALSGGIDSSAIASVIGKNYQDTEFKTFTIYYEGKGDVDERPFASAVVDQYKNLKPFYYQPDEKELIDDFEKVMQAQEIPMSGSSPISQYYVMKLAAKHKIKVLLDGQGSDEYLAGYMHSFYRYIGGYLKNFHIKKGLEALKDHARLQGFGKVKTADIFVKSALAGVMNEQQFYELEYKKFYPFVSNQPKTQVPFELENRDTSRLNKFLYHLLFHTMLPSLLHYEDRNSMAFSIESRVPFLDHNLVEFAFSLPDDDKIHKAQTKYILREALKEELPFSIYNRKDKKGFVTPGEVKWLRGPLSFLLEADFSNLDFLDQKKVKSVMDDYKKGNNKNAILVWRIAVLNYWMKRVI